LQHYHTAIELDEENVDAYVCIGNIYEILKKPDKAKFYYKQA
jgi:Tfp pilus assembly protein PilF